MDLATGQNLIKQKKFPQALKLFEYLAKLDPNNQDLNFYLGRIYSELYDFINGIKFYKKYLEFNNNSIPCLLNLAILFLNIGDKKNSEQYFKKLIKINNNYVYAYYGLFSLSEKLLNDKDFNHLKKVLKNRKTNLKDKSIINFLLSKKERKNKNIERELGFLHEYHKQSFDSNILYNKQSQFYYENVLKNFYNKINLTNSPKKYENIKPIFIIGLPRSGSTLIESLLSSGEIKVRTYGECNYFNMAIFDQIKNKIFTKEFTINKSAIDIDLNSIEVSIEDRYAINNKQDNNLLFLDKSLENIFNIEIILKIFPNAKFIHTKRNIKDAILSIYFSMLPELSWTLSLENINNYINNYQETIFYFKKKFPKKIFEVDLDEFTSNVEKGSKNLFKFCDLKWHDEVLNFYKRKDLFSKTISSSQIRQEISQKHKSSYNKYYYLLDKV